MKCPCRLNKEYDVKQMGNGVFITAEREVYPDCYEDECPFYDSCYDRCNYVVKQLEEE